MMLNICEISRYFYRFFAITFCAGFYNYSIQGFLLFKGVHLSMIKSILINKYAMADCFFPHRGFEDFGNSRQHYILAYKIGYFYLFHNQFSKPKGRK